MQKLVWKNKEGEELDLTNYSAFGITEWEGFSNTELNIQSQQVPYQDGSVFLDALMSERELNITLAIRDNGNLRRRYELRRELIHKLNPKLGEGLLIYTNDFISKQIKCVPHLPIFENHNSDDVGTPKASLSWTANNPYWEDVEQSEIIMNGEGTFQLDYDGDVPATLELEYAGNDQYLKFENTTTGKKLEIETNTHKNILFNTGVGTKFVKSQEINKVGRYAGFSYSYVSAKNGKIVWMKPSSEDYNTLIILSLVNGSYYLSEVVRDFRTNNDFQKCDLTFSSVLQKYIINGVESGVLLSSDCKTWEFVGNINYFEANGVLLKAEYNIETCQTTISKSTDGTSWTQILQKTYSNNVYLDCFIYWNNTYFMGFSDRLENLLKSTNLTTWTTYTPSNLPDDFESFNLISYMVEYKGCLCINFYQRNAYHRDCVVVNTSNAVIADSMRLDELIMPFFNGARFTAGSALITGKFVLADGTEGLFWGSESESDRCIILSNGATYKQWYTTYDNQSKLFYGAGDNNCWYGSYNHAIEMDDLDFLSIVYDEQKELYYGLTEERIYKSENLQFWQDIAENNGLIAIFEGNLCIGAGKVAVIQNDVVNYFETTEQSPVRIRKLGDVYYLCGADGLQSSGDLENWESVFSDEAVFDCVVLEEKLYFLTEDKVYMGSNGEPVAVLEVTGEHFHSTEFSEDYGIGIIVGDAIYKTANYTSLEEVTEIESEGDSVSFSKNCFWILTKEKMYTFYQGLINETDYTLDGEVKKSKNGVISTAGGNVTEFILKTDANLIHTLTEDSSMNIKIELGRNILNFDADINSIMIIKYKRQYLGV